MDHKENYASAGESATKGLVVRNVHTDFTDDEMRDIFSKFGEILRMNRKDHLVFIDYSNANQAEAACNGLRNNHHGFRVVKSTEKSRFKSKIRNDGRQYDSFKNPAHERVPNVELDTDADSHRVHRPMRAGAYPEDEEAGAPCYHCRRITVKLCMKCHTPFCSMECQRDAAEVHLSFCRNLYVGLGANSNKPVMKGGCLSWTRFQITTPNAVNPSRVSAASSSSAQVKLTTPHHSVRGAENPPTPPESSEAMFRFKRDTGKPSVNGKDNNFSDPKSRGLNAPVEPHSTNLFVNGEENRVGPPSGALMKPHTPEFTASGRENYFFPPKSGGPNANVKPNSPEASVNGKENGLTSPIPRGPNAYVKPPAPEYSVSGRDNHFFPPARVISTPGESPAKELEERRKHDPNTAMIGKVLNGGPDSSKSHGSDAAQRSPRRAFDKFKTLTFMYPEKGGWWVLPETNIKEYNRVTQVLAHCDIDHMPGVLPFGNLVCAAVYQEVWYRVRIITTKPVLNVHFIDYGNTEACGPADLRSLPASIQDIPDLVFFVKFAEGSAPAYDLLDQTIKVREVGEEDAVKIVQLVSESPAVRRPSSIDSGTKSSASSQEPYMAPSSNRSSEVKSGAPVERVPAQVTVPAPSIAYSSNPVLPQLPPATATAPSSELVTYPSQKSVAAPVNGGNYSTLPTDRFTSGSTVVIEVVHKLNRVSISLVKEESEYHLHTVHLNIVCPSAQPPGQLPPIGTLVGALFDDGKFYRGRVTELAEGKAHVDFIDFGNDEWVKLENLRPLTAIISDKPPAAYAVDLRGVPDVKSVDGGNILDDISCNRTHLTLGFAVNASAGVELTDDLGRSINARLIACAESLTEEYAHPQVVEKDDYHIIPLRDGEQPVILLHWDETSVGTDGIVYCVSFNEPAIIYVLTDMPHKLEAMKNEMKMNAYRPHYKEMCCALFDGQWARAWCINSAEDNPSLVRLFFIDYGNEVTLDTAFVRPLQREYKDLPAIANRCKIPGIERARTAAQKLSISRLLGDVANNCQATIFPLDADTKTILIPAVEDILRDS